MTSLARFLKFLFLMLFVLAGFIFAIRNSSAVGLWLLADLAPRPLGLWILLAFAAGGLLGLLVGYGLWRKIRLGWQLRQLQGQLRHCQQELAALRQQHAADENTRDT